MKQITPQYCQCKYPLIRVDPLNKEYCGKCDRYFEELKTRKMKPIKLKELRLGNYVIDAEDREDENIYVVSRIETKEYTEWNTGDEYNCVTHRLDCKDCYYEMRPYGIELTEEILLRLGATKMKENYLGFKYSRFKLIWKEGYKYWYVIDWQDETYMTKIEWLHEFQNFVFAMDGGELELKPKQ